MKPFEQQTYYELLDLPPSASDTDIREAHARALEMYAPDSVAVYALEDPTRLQALRARITEAMEMLTDAELRAEYDQSIGLPPRARERVAALQAAAQGETQVPSQNRGAASRLFARVASPQPGFSISYVALAPLPLFAPSQLVHAEPAPAASAPEPVSAQVPGSASAAPEPVVVAAAPRAPEPARTEAPREEPAAPAAAAVAGPVEPSVARASDEPPAAESPPQETALALSPVAARAREPRPEPRSEEPRPRLPEIPPDAEFNGELLRRVREMRGFTLRVLADRTKIGTRHLENVEADRYDALPTSVYLRGILMNLARELGLDPLRVSKSYLALASKPRGR